MIWTEERKRKGINEGSYFPLPDIPPLGRVREVIEPETSNMLCRLSWHYSKKPQKLQVIIPHRETTTERQRQRDRE